MEGERIDYIAMKVKAWRTDDYVSYAGFGIYLPYSVGETPPSTAKRVQ